MITNVLPTSWRISLPKTITTVFLDRDGVINEKMPEGQYVSSENEFRILRGVPEAIARLNRAGIRVLVVSNQRGIALGIMTSEAVERIHSSLQQQLNTKGAVVDGFYYCPHDRNSCSCRKPLPGLFQQAIIDFPDINAETCVMIGDSISDIEFGRRLGMYTVEIQGSLGHRKPNWEQAMALADCSCCSLQEAVRLLLGSC